MRRGGIEVDLPDYFERHGSSRTVRNPPADREKDLNIGMKENTVFSVFHSDAMDLYNSCSDLQKICYDLADPEHRLEENVRLYIALGMLYLRFP